MSLKQMSKKIKGGIGLFLVMILGLRIIILGVNWPSFDKNILVSNFETTFFNETGSKNSAKDSAKGEILASKNGTKYYFSNCSGAKKIKSENIVYFSSEEQAESAGYTLAKNCKKP